MEGLADRAYVYRDGALLGILDRGKPKGLLEQLRPKNALPFPPSPAGTQVEILVEAMGRVNYGNHLEDRKGLTGVRLGGQFLMEFTVTTLPLEDLAGAHYRQGASRYPLLLRGRFETDSQADCFVDLDGFTKGMVYVNGFHLGRYWSCGPQKTLYLPGVLLHTDRPNELVVLELEATPAPGAAHRWTLPGIGAGVFHRRTKAAAKRPQVWQICRRFSDWFSFFWKKFQLRFQAGAPQKWQRQEKMVQKGA